MKKRTTSVLKKGSSKSKMYIEETFTDLKQSTKLRTKIMDKLQKGLQFHTSGTQQLRSVCEDIKAYAEELSKNEENAFLGSWYTKLGTFLKRYSDLHILLNNALTINLLEPIQQFTTKDVEEAMLTKKKYDRAHQLYAEGKIKLESAKKKEKNPAKVQEMENEYIQLQAGKDLAKATVINQLKELTETGYYSNLDNVWDTIDSFAVFFKEGLTSINKLSLEAVEDKEKLTDHKEARTVQMNEKMEQFKEKYLKQLRESQERSKLKSSESDQLNTSVSPRLDGSLALDLSAERKDSDKGDVLSPRSSRRRMKHDKKSASTADLDLKRSFEECSDPIRSLLLRFIYTETKYNNTLTTLVKSYYEPFTQEFKDKYEERDILFSNILDIYNHQSSVLDELTRCKEQWPSINLVDALLKHLDGLRVYKPYLINYGTSTKVIEKLLKTKNFQTFFNNCNNQTGFSFLSLLESPTMAFSTLKLQLELIMKKNACDSSHIEKLENAFDLLQRINDEIEIKKLNKYNMSKITLLQERLVNFEGRIDDNADRFIIHESSAILTTESTSSEIENDTTKSKYYIVLCNDIILITKKSVKLITRENRVIRDKKYKVVHNFNVLDITLNEQADNETSFSVQVIGAVDEEVTTHTFFAQSKEDKQLWISKINQQIELSNSKKLFGTAIEEIVRRENKLIPAIIDTTIKTIIEGGGIQAEGLIRVSGNARQIKDLRRNLDLGGRLNVDKVDTHTVCGLLKLYLRCLPEPIMGAKSYDLLQDVATQYSDEEKLDKRLKGYKGILEKLPDTNKFSLQTIFAFFDLLASFSTINKMHSRNIAIVMGPILLTNNEKVSWDMSKQNNAIEIVDQMINNYTYLFSTIKAEKETRLTEQTKGRSHSISDTSPDESIHICEEKDKGSPKVDDSGDRPKRSRKPKESHRRSKMKDKEVVKESMPKESLKDSPKESLNDSPKGDVPQIESDA